MDQGFSAQDIQGLAVPRVAPRIGRTAPVHGHVRPAAAGTTAKSAHPPAVVSSAVALEQVALSERRTEGTLNKTQSRLMLPGLLELGGLVVTPLLWLTGKIGFTRARTVLGSTFRGSVEALKNTQVSEAFHLPANFMQSVAAQATESKAEGMAAKAIAASSKLRVHGEAANGAVGKFFAAIGESGVVKAMPKMLKTVASKAAGMNLFSAMMVTGLAAGGVGAWFGARAQSKESTAATQAMMADAGANANSPFIQAVLATNTSNQRWAVGKAALQTVGAALTSVFFTKPHFGGGAFMAVSMLPDVCAMLVSDNQTLGGYVALKKIDAGQLTLDREAHAKILMALIALEPSIAARGGIYNRSNAAMAHEMIERKMSASQVVQVLSNETAFTVFAAEVKAKQEAHAAEQKAALKDQPVGEAKAPVHAVAAEKTVDIHAKAANGHAAGHGAHTHAAGHHEAHAHATGHHHAAGHPAHAANPAGVSLAGAQLEGRVHDHMRALG